jgi:PKD repeat protein
MTRFTWSAALLAVLAGVLALSAAAGPLDPPYPQRIDFPAPTVDPITGAVTTNFSPEGMAVSGDTFYAGSTATGEIIKGNLKTGMYQRNWVAASPAQPSDLHRGILGLLVDGHGRVWAASSVGMACGGGGTQPACPAGAPTPQVNYGAIFVYDGNTGAELAQYTVSNLAGKLMNDMTIAQNRLVIANTTAPACNPPVPPATTPTNTNCDTQFEIPLGPGGALPPGDTPPTGNTGASVPCGTKLCPAYQNPVVVALPTPGFISADGIDTLPNGHVVVTSVSGNPVPGGQMINLDPVTGTWSYITVTAADRPTPPGVPPLLSLDGVTLDGNMLYAPENRTDVATCPTPNTTLSCPGDWAAIHLDPPGYTTGEVISRLNSPAGSGLPPLRSPANMEQLGHSVYGITRVVSANPVTGAANVTQTFIERLDKLALTAAGSAVGATEGASFTGPTATFTDPNNGPIAANSYPQQGSSAYGYTATISWGDGTATSSGTVTGGGTGSLSVAGTHTYAEEGSYPVTTTVVDMATGATLTTTTSTATVADAALTATPVTITGVEGTAVTGAVANVADANHDGSAADLTATINWGDGSPADTGTVTGTNGSYAVNGSHVYADQGTYSVTVNVTDDGGATASTTSTANIAFAPGCRNAGDARADAEFLLPGSKKGLEVDLNAKCKVAHGRHGHHGHPAGSIYIHDAHVEIDGGPVSIDAESDHKQSEITTVKIVGNTASIVGSDNGNTFVVVVTDNGKGKGAVDTVHVTVWNSSGTVILDSSTLTPKHNPDVEVRQK